MANARTNTSLIAVLIVSFTVGACSVSAPGTEAVVVAANPAAPVAFAFPEDETAYETTLAVFEEAGFDVPAFTARFHTSAESCGGNWGLHVRTSDGVSTIHVCYTHERPLQQQIARGTTLRHEVAHAWVAQNVSDEQIATFMQVRGLEVWETPGTPWPEMGAEHAAEILLWGLTGGAHGINAQIDDSDEASLGVAYRVLVD